MKQLFILCKCPRRADSVLKKLNRLEDFWKINGLPALRQKLRITHECAWCHLSLFTRHVLPPNQDLISRSWPAGRFITASRAGWCLWWCMPVGITYPSSLHWPNKPSLMRYHPAEAVSRGRLGAGEKICMERSMDTTFSRNTSGSCSIVVKCRCGIFELLGVTLGRCDVTCMPQYH